MKKCVILLTIFAAFSVTGCKSNEEKANELIRTELSKTLYDFDSYQPIETIVKEAKNTALNNEECWAYAMVAISFLNDATKDIEKAKNAQEYMEIWGPPTYYSSSRSDRKYYEYKKECNEHLANAERNLKKSKVATDSLKCIKIRLDTMRIIGWEVNHKFRCKSKGGYASIGNHKYIIDKNFEKIIFQTDTDDEKYSMIIDILTNVDQLE